MGLAVGSTMYCTCVELGLHTRELRWERLCSVMVNAGFGLHKVHTHLPPQKRAHAWSSFFFVLTLPILRTSLFELHTASTLFPEDSLG